jgi:hypothetical protein
MILQSSTIEALNYSAPSFGINLHPLPEKPSSFCMPIVHLDLLCTPHSTQQKLQGHISILFRSPQLRLCRMRDVRRTVHYPRLQLKGRCLFCHQQSPLTLRCEGHHPLGEEYGSSYFHLLCCQIRRNQGSDLWQFLQRSVEFSKWTQRWLPSICTQLSHWNRPQQRPRTYRGKCLEERDDWLRYSKTETYFCDF